MTAYSSANASNFTLKSRRRSNESPRAAAQFGKALDLLAALPACHKRNERELDLLRSLASALINAKGYRAPEAEPAYARAMELCEVLGETERIFPALFGRYISAVMDGRAAEALGWASEFVRRADSRGDVTLELLGHRVMAPALCVTGQPQSALDHCLEGLALYDPERDADLHLQYGSDVKVYFSWMASFASWLLGFPDQAQAHTEKGGERWSEAEIPRVRGEVFRDLSRHAEAETQFDRALAIARSQGANSLALRAATSLARLRQQQGRPREGRDVLAPVYAWFTEGFDTPDLKEAKALLGELS